MAEPGTFQPSASDKPRRARRAVGERAERAGAMGRERRIARGSLVV